MRALLQSGMTLPTEVERWARAVIALHDLEPPADIPEPKKPGHLRDEELARCVEAAFKGKPRLPDASFVAAAEEAVLAHRKAIAEAREQGELLKAARRQGMSKFLGVVAEHLDEIGRPLGEWMDKLVSEAREAAPLVRGLTIEAALTAGEDVRTAYRRLDELAVEYLVMRRVQSLLDAAQPAIVDTHGYFSIFRNLPAIVTEHTSTMVVLANPPWPTDDPREFIVWAVQHPVLELWAPTPRDRDRAYEDQIGQVMQRGHAVVKGDELRAHRAIGV